ncbi:hypothetical protein AGMMS49573_04750 [Endomicrobiia bacterium]|uniref:S1 RNA-binding domain-containing protein n=1 Tax=Endomicrobium trichonymphae TaxID=1408204 RepID=UPI001551B997|nr:S1 RNA-binding domain-containing protein [Candidatus Endomicrobium trichonymphae]GHT06997.1 hypothetical protein AGMMS49523_10210 [Endomicrobiia bacterium]GHT07017.1 hypothetical protein AGMMS49523_10300 [Endomicrobiia bacterium]GHT09856.1 hypothetical protein AGMMS49532_08830 [Endomicrobiia bacterium]GHT13640.1 hypothetical protein AGMMS49571_07750 [Endomicrobiia bacterium]GHT16126.1 hypothetical protein AGMMS49573_04750 [Endomicrobiia bacterium]
MKNFTPYPWEFADKRFPVGLIVEGIVTAVMSYGAFVELEQIASFFRMHGMTAKRY